MLENNQQVKIDKIYCKDYKGNQEIRGFEWKNQ